MVRLSPSSEEASKFMAGVCQGQRRTCGLGCDLGKDSLPYRNPKAESSNLTPSFHHA